MSRINRGNWNRKSERSTSTSDGLKLIELLQNFVVQQNEQIENQKAQISVLTKERDHCQAELFKLRQENEDLKSRIDCKIRGSDPVTDTANTSKDKVKSIQTDSSWETCIQSELFGGRDATDGREKILPPKNDFTTVLDNRRSLEVQEVEISIDAKDETDHAAIMDNIKDVKENSEVTDQRTEVTKESSGVRLMKSNSLNLKGTEKDNSRERSSSAMSNGSDSSSLKSPSRTSSFDSKGSPKTRRVKRTPSGRSRHVIRQESKGRIDLSYELSADLKAITVDMLEKKYGGKERANKAARTIQEYYRHWNLSRSFKRVRAYSEKRKRSSAHLTDKQRESMKKLFGQENPVLIVDMTEDEELGIIANIDDSESNQKDSKTEQNGADASNSITVVPSQDIDLDKISAENNRNSSNEEDHNEKGKKIILTTNSTFFLCQPKGKIDREQIQGKEVQWEAEKEEKDIENEETETEIKESSDQNSDYEHQRLLRVQSCDSYEIIDENQVLQVIGKIPKRLPGEYSEDESNVSQDKGGSDSDSCSLNNDSIFYPDHNSYTPTVDKSQRWRFRIGINLFNSKPEDGIEYLIDNQLLENDPKSIAEFLRRDTSISKQKISEFFGNLRKPFNMNVLEAFGDSFDFTGKEIDEALRQFQAYFKLTGEAQSVEKFLQVFSKRYVECNPGRLSKNPDTILLMAFAIAMLNTDLHNQNVKRKMDVEGFIRNLRGTDDGNDLPEELLRGVFHRIQKNELSTGADHITQLKQIESSFVGKTPTIAEPHRQFVKLFTIEEVYDPNRKDKPHHRLAFLFNDMLLLTKPRGRAGQFGSGHIFSFKSSFKLLGTQVAEFSNEHYPFGVYLQTRLDQKTLGCFMLKDEKLRKEFVEELDDCIRETNGMENIRIALSKAKQLPRHGYKDLPESFTLDRKKTKLKKRSAETMSLINVSVNNSSLEAEDITGSFKERSSSMLNINEPNSDTESDPGIRRVNSSTSLDASLTETSRTFPRQAARSPSIRKMFFHFPSRRRKYSNEKRTPPESRKEVGLSRFFAEEDSIGESDA